MFNGDHQQRVATAEFARGNYDLDYDVEDDADLLFASGNDRSAATGGGLKFAPFNRLQDTQAVRAVDFHPSGQVYAIGSNSRSLRICAYPAESELAHFRSVAMDNEELERDLRGENHTATAMTKMNASANSGDTATNTTAMTDKQQQSSASVPSPRVLFKFLQFHRGSIYCVAFSKSGQWLASGSNDQTVHLVRYNSATHSAIGGDEEFRLRMHDGTVRAVSFVDDAAGGSSLLLSAGGGDNKIYVTDCDTVTPFQSLAGHTAAVTGLHHSDGATFVSCSLDKTIRFWDLRTRGCTSIVSAPQRPTGGVSSSSSSNNNKWGGPGAPVCSVKLDHTGRLLASGHADATCMLYDTRGAKIVQTFKPQRDELRTLAFSPKSYYLLTGGYDGRLVLSDLQGDLTQRLPSVRVGESGDKVVQVAWHPRDFTFVATGADRAATLWAIPAS